jgi:glycosyltransferase involved in cell wall biosynthesis
MNILNVNMSIDSVRGGGTAERTVQQSVALVALGHNCKILTLDLGVTQDRKNELKNVELILVPCLWRRFYIPTPSFRLINSAIREADVIHLMGHWTLINAIAYYYINRLKKKYVVCPAGALQIFGRSAFMKRMFNLLVGKRIIKCADAHVAIVKDEISQFEAYGVEASKVCLIPNGISLQSDSPKIDIRKKLRIGLNPYLLFMGRLNIIKGPDLLLEAFWIIKDEFPEVNLVFAGPDEGMLLELQRYCQVKQLSNRVYFVGHIGGDDKNSLFKESSIVVIPSRQEAMSIVVLEAATFKVPVVLTDKCGLNELAEMSAAVIVKPTAVSLARGLSLVLSSEDKGARLAKSLFQYVDANYRWDMIAKKMESLFLRTQRSV